MEGTMAMQLATSCRLASKQGVLMTLWRQEAGVSKTLHSQHQCRHHPQQTRDANKRGIASSLLIQRGLCTSHHQPDLWVSHKRTSYIVFAYIYTYSLNCSIQQHLICGRQLKKYTDAGHRIKIYRWNLTAAFSGVLYSLACLSPRRESYHGCMSCGSGIGNGSKTANESLMTNFRWAFLMRVDWNQSSYG